jgi:hypothetical protein
MVLVAAVYATTCMRCTTVNVPVRLPIDDISVTQLPAYRLVLVHGVDSGETDACAAEP